MFLVQCTCRHILDLSKLLCLRTKHGREHRPTHSPTYSSTYLLSHTQHLRHVADGNHYKDILQGCASVGHEWSAEVAAGVDM